MLSLIPVLVGWRTRDNQNQWCRSSFACMCIIMPLRVEKTDGPMNSAVFLWIRWTFSQWIPTTAFHWQCHLVIQSACTVNPKKYTHGFVVLCFVVVTQSFIMNSHEVFIHIHQGCFAGTGAIVRLPQCQWSKPDGYGKISQCITTTKDNKAKTVCIFIGIYCTTADPCVIMI